jgi:hypothetical protein
MEGAMACQYASCVNRRLVIAATRNWSATRNPYATERDAAVADPEGLGAGRPLVVHAARKTARVRAWRD